MIGRRIQGLALAAAITALAFGMEARGVEAATPGEPGTISIQSRTALVGETIPVNLRAEQIPSPGLGAWTFDIEYQPSVISVVDCAAGLQGVCNTRFEENKVRVTGASSTGLTGSFSLGTVAITCLNEGRSELTLSFEIFSVAVIQPQLFELQNGTITCVTPEEARAPTPTAPTPTTQPSLPPSGTGPASDWSVPQWAMALLTAAGASLVALAAVRSERA